MPTTWTTVTDPIGDTGAFDSRLIFGDFDGDGDIDILFQNGNTAGAGIGYMRNNGNGTFTTFTDATSAGSIFQGVDLSGRQITPQNFFILDFDGDGDLDILDRTSNTTTFFRNEGNAGFTRITDPIPDTGSFDQRMVWGDFDNDGDVDALYQNGNSAGAGIGFLRNDGGLSFTNFTNAAAAGTPFTGVVFTGLQITTSTFVVDVDDDGDMDIIDRGTTQVLYRNDGGSGFVRTADPLADIGSFDARMVFGDFDSDGDTDAIYQNGNVAGSGFGYFRNDGGTFTNFTSLAGTPFSGLDLTAQQLTTWTAVDIDGDGDVDIVDRDQAGGGLVLYRQNGAPPRLSATSPSDNGAGVAVGANITLTFSESVSQGAGNIYIYRGDGTLLETIAVGSAQVSGSGTTWTIDPSITLAGLTSYYILIDQETFVDIEGAVFAGIFNPATLNFQTASSNTAPTFTNLNGDVVAHTENVPVRLDTGGNATVADTESVNFDTGTLTVAITANGVAGQDVLGIANIGNGAGQIGVSGSAILYGGVQIGTFTGGSAGANLVITFDADATPAATQALVRALTYNNTSDAPNTASRTVTVVLTDGDGGTSTTQTVTVGVTAVNDPHTGGAAITGTQAENGVLTAVSTIADPDGLGTLHYQWQRDTGGGFVNVGADQSTYTLGDADVGGVVRVVIYYTDAGGTVESATSAASAAITAVNDPHTGGVSITGTATENQTLTAASTLADADGLGTLHYDWQRDTGSGFVSIGAADQSTYTLGDADVGGVVRVVVSYTDGQGFSESATSAGTAAVANVNDPHTGGAAITGPAAEDGVLTAVSTLADADGLGTLHYQWQRDTGGGFVNVGTDQATYTLGDADVGGVVRVVISYTDQQGTVESATSAVTAAISNVNDVHTGGASITGTATENQVLTADTSTLADNDGLGTIHYQWQRDTGSGFVNVGTDQATYTLGDADVGGVVRVVIAYVDQQGTAESAISAATAAISAVNDAHTGGVAITGTATENQTLTATSTLADVDGLGTLHYDWQRDTGSGFVSIGAADQSTYTLGDADVGGVVRVVVSYTDGQGFAESATSAGTAAVVNVNDLPTGGATITGTFAEDQVLTAVSTLADADGLGTLHYQWQRDIGGGFVNVGADQSTYTLGDSDIGGVVRVVVYYTDQQGTVESATSAASSAISATNDAPTGGVSLTGTATEDQVLTADTSTLADADGLGTLHYDWQRDTGSGFVSTGAADQATYTLGDADVGGVVRVIVSYTDGQGFANTVTSPGTAAVANVNDVHTGGVSITGTATEDQVLTADASTLADADGLGTIHYQWQRDTGSGFVNVGADQATYTLGDADVGGVVRVVAYYTDDQGTVESATSTATGAIANIDDLPVALNDAVSTVESAPVSGSLFANNGSGADSDVDGPALTIAAVNGSAAGVGTQITLASGALLTVNADGTYSYNPNGRFDNLPGSGSGSVNTATDTFTYTLAGGNTATVTVTINGEFSSTGDVQVGTGGDDTQTGGMGNDTFVAGAGNDSIDGGAGIDTVTYSAAPTGVIVRLNHGDVLNDGYGDTDTISGVENVTGTAFNDTIIGQNGANVIIGGAGYDVLLGLGGDDVLFGGSGAANEMYGGAGNDTYYTDANDTIVESAGEGIDSVVTTQSVFRLANNLERLYFRGTGDFTGIGNAENNTIVGGAGNDTISGGAGYDVLIGGNGNDTLGGGSGAANELYGGLGDDTFIVDADDTIIELAGQGNDTVRTSLSSFNLGANIETLIYTGTDGFVGVGNALDNVINGRSGNDILTGGGGADTLNGGDGRDTAVLRGVAADYTITYVSGSTWTVTDNVGGRDGVDTITNIEALAFSDGSFRILTPPPAAPLPAPTPADEDLGARLVRPALTGGDFALTLGDGDELTLPTLTHDDFLFTKDGDLGPQVQPGLLGGDEPLVLPIEDPFGRPDHGLVPTAHTDDTMLVHPQHDDWML